MADRALLLIDVQNDFCSGGALPVPGGERVVPVLNAYIDRFKRLGLPVYASRDWHPSATRHFRDYGGPWPPHCVQDTRGAEFHPDLQLPQDTTVISSGTGPEEHGYSAFEGRDPRGRDLAGSLRQDGVKHLYVGGLATDYCVLQSVMDARRVGFEVTLLLDAVRGIDVQEGDTARALDQMLRAGTRTATLASAETELA